MLNFHDQLTFYFKLMYVEEKNQICGPQELQRPCSLCQSLDSETSQPSI